MPRTKYNTELLNNFISLVEEWNPFISKDDSTILEDYFDKGDLTALCFHLEISRPRIKDYCKKHPRFKEVFEKWLIKRDHYFLKLARIYHKKPANTAQWIYMSKNILGWSDNPSNTEDADNSLPQLIKVIESSARKISSNKKASRSKKC